MKTHKAISRASLAIILSKLKNFENPKLREEQYSTDSESAASLLWDLHMKGRITGKVIADLGAGTGILGLGAALLGAKKVYLVEKDPDAAKLAKDNLDDLKTKYELKSVEIINSDISDFHKKDLAVGMVDMVLMNPPFGTKTKHADKMFLEKAFKIAGEIYSFHKSSTSEFIIKFCADNGFAAEKYMNIQFPIKASHRFHSRKIHRIEVACFRIVRAGQA